MQDIAAAPGEIEQTPAPSSQQQDDLAAQSPTHHNDGHMALPEASCAADHGQLLNDLSSCKSFKCVRITTCHSRRACYARSTRIASCLASRNGVALCVTCSNVSVVHNTSNTFAMDVAVYSYCSARCYVRCTVKLIYIQYGHPKWQV